MNTDKDSYLDYVELAMMVCNQETDKDLDTVLRSTFGIDLDSFVNLVDALIPFTVPGKIITLDGSTEYAKGFVYEGAFIVKKLHEPKRN